jgi:hypothetical protein
MLERHQTEGRTADAIADDLTGAFEQYRRKVSHAETRSRREVFGGSASADR